MTKGTTSKIKAGSVGPLSLDAVGNSGDVPTWNQVPHRLLLPTGDPHVLHWETVVESQSIKGDIRQMSGPLPTPNSPMETRAWHGMAHTHGNTACPPAAPSLALGVSTGSRQES